MRETKHEAKAGNLGEIGDVRNDFIAFITTL
jgi:hypothetical protein